MTGKEERIEMEETNLLIMVSTSCSGDQEIAEENSNACENEDYSDIVNSFVEVFHTENISIHNYYESLLRLPQNDDFFNNMEIKESLILKEENYAIILKNLFQLDFYSNLQKLIDMNLKSNKQAKVFKRLKLIEKYICEILGVAQYEDLTIESFDNIFVMENVLKYLLEFEFDKFIQNNTLNLTTINFQSTFLKLLQTILDRKNDKRSFGCLFGKFIKERTHENVLIADVNVLLQVAYLTNNSYVIMEILKSKYIDVNQLKIRAIKNRRFVWIVAEKGYFKFLEAMSRKDIQMVFKNSSGNDVSIFVECLKGSMYFKSDCPNQYSICCRKYDECIDILMNHKNFEEVLKVDNPMKIAVKYRNNATILKLFNKFGLNLQCVQKLDRNSLEMLLDSCVSESKGICIDCGFMKNETCGIDALVHLISNNETKELITHPVLSTLIEIKIRRFSNLYLINLMAYLLCNIGMIFLGFYSNNGIPFLVGATFLLLRELLQFYYYQKTLKSFNERFGFDKNILKSFSGIRGNIMELVLILSTIACGISLIFGNSTCYQLFLISTVLLSAIELSILLTEVVSLLAIYMFMLQTVMETFLKTSMVVILYIFAFGFCFHIVFYHPNQDLDEFTSFGDWFMMIFKTSVMLSGEYDVSDLNLDGYISKLLIWVFVLTAILLLNFINALAIADVQKLKEKAEFLDLKLKLLTIQRHYKLIEKCIDSNWQVLIKTIIQKIIPQPYKVTKQIIDENRQVKFITENYFEIKPFRISKDSYNRLKDILKGKEICEEQQYMEKRFDSLTFEMAQFNSKLQDIDKIKKEMIEIKSLLYNVLEGQRK